MFGKDIPAFLNVEVGLGIGAALVSGEVSTRPGAALAQTGLDIIPRLWLSILNFSYLTANRTVNFAYFPD
jgi:hypothetical protein